QWNDIDGDELAAAIVRLQERGLVREEFFETYTIGGVSNIRIIGLDKGDDTFYALPLRKSTTKHPKRLFEKGHKLAEYFGMNGTHNEYGDEKRADGRRLNEFNRGYFPEHSYIFRYNIYCYSILF